MTAPSETSKQHFIIARESDVAVATYATRAFAEELGFTTVMQLMIATAVSELATNTIRYAHRGYITIGRVIYKEQIGIEVIAEDQGPGIKDRARAMTDSMSTSKSLGLGLPGVKRLMDEFFLDSAESMGTKIVARKWKPL